MTRFVRGAQDVALLLLRIVVGVTLVAHGWHRWQLDGVASQIARLEQAGVGYANALVWAVIAFELVGGILLVCGLATPLVGLGLVVLNVGIIVVLKWGSFYAHEQGWEYNAVMAAVGCVLLAFGSGRAGVDHLFTRPKDVDSDLIADETEADRIRSGRF